MVQEGFLPSPRCCCYEFLCALQETIKTEKAANPKSQSNFEKHGFFLDLKYNGMPLQYSQMPSGLITLIQSPTITNLPSE